MSVATHLRPGGDSPVRRRQLADRNGIDEPGPASQEILADAPPREPPHHAILRKGAEAMEVHFTAEVQAKLERWTSETGRPANELLQDALAGYFDELASTREMLNSRYDDLKSGRVDRKSTRLNSSH